MFKELLCLAVALVAARATGEFVVLHSPDSVVFSGSEEIEQSSLKDILAAALGYTSKLRIPSDAMTITDPFNFPEAVVAVAFEGIDSLAPIKYMIKYPLIVDEVEETTWQALRERVEERDDGNMLVRISVGDGLDALGQSVLGELKPTELKETSLNALNLNREEDKKYVEEILLLHAIANKVPSAIKADSKPDIYWLVVSGLKPVVDLYGSNSTQSNEAQLLLNNALNHISDAFIDAYDGKVVITAFTNDASQVRHSRSVLLDRQTRDINTSAGKNKNVESASEANGVGNYTEFTNKKVSLKQDDREDESKKVEDEGATDTNTDSTSEPNSDIDTTTANNSFRDDSEESEKSDKEHETRITVKYTGQGIKNLSKTYNEDYPVIFNIILWFGVVFFFALLAVCIAIADMDPGRDSIIYRMTSNRMKKDN